MYCKARLKTSTHTTWNTGPRQSSATICPCVPVINVWMPEPGLENREYGRWDPSFWPRGTLYPQKLALTLLTRGGRSVGIVRSRNEATEFFLFLNSWTDVMKHDAYIIKPESIQTAYMYFINPWNQSVSVSLSVLPLPGSGSIKCILAFGARQRHN
jgi:hypothetical protein